MILYDIMCWNVCILQIQTVNRVKSQKVFVMHMQHFYIRSVFPYCPGQLPSMPSHVVALDWTYVCSSRPPSRVVGLDQTYVCPSRLPCTSSDWTRLTCARLDRTGLTCARLDRLRASSDWTRLTCARLDRLARRQTGPDLPVLI